MKLHQAPDGLRRCRCGVGTCPYGGPVAQTPTRDRSGGGRATVDASLPLGSTGVGAQKRAFVRAERRVRRGSTALSASVATPLVNPVSISELSRPEKRAERAALALETSWRWMTPEQRVTTTFDYARARLDSLGLADVELSETDAEDAPLFTAAVVDENGAVARPAQVALNPVHAATQGWLPVRDAVANTAALALIGPVDAEGRRRRSEGRDADWVVKVTELGGVPRRSVDLSRGAWRATPLITSCSVCGGRAPAPNSAEVGERVLCPRCFSGQTAVVEESPEPVVSKQLSVADARAAAASEPPAGPPVVDEESQRAVWRANWEFKRTARDAYWRPLVEQRSENLPVVKGAPTLAERFAPAYEARVSHEMEPWEQEEVARDLFASCVEEINREVRDAERAQRSAERERNRRRGNYRRSKAREYAARTGQKPTSPEPAETEPSAEPEEGAGEARPPRKMRRRRAEKLARRAAGEVTEAATSEQVSDSID